MPDCVQSTDLKEFKLFKRGKVRDIYDLGDNFLFISTDRISCFDVILSDCIPYKGIVLNKLSVFWFNFTKDIINNHFISADINSYPKELLKYKDLLENRSMIVKKASPIPIECVVRGYLSGSAWEEYKKTNSVCGIKLPPNLLEADKLKEPIFTPAIKKDIGHDINISEELLKKEFPSDLIEKIKKISLELYKKASVYAESKGIIIADTKFEFGFYNKELVLIDEIFTPDSSRFWPKKSYKPGCQQISFDKQFVRDYLDSIKWNRTPPLPKLPEDIILKTSEKYLEILDRFLN